MGNICKFPCSLCNRSFCLLNLLKDLVYLLQAGRGEILLLEKWTIRIFTMQMQCLLSGYWRWEAMWIQFSWEFQDVWIFVHFNCFEFWQIHLTLFECDRSVIEKKNINKCMILTFANAVRFPKSFKLYFNKKYLTVSILDTTRKIAMWCFKKCSYQSHFVVFWWRLLKQLLMIFWFHWSISFTTYFSKRRYLLV